MNPLSPAPSGGRTVTQFRREFDQSFAVRQSPLPDVEDLLAIDIGGDPYAIRLRDIAGIVDRGALVAVPSRRIDLLGVTGIRGAIVPVFALAAVLGYAVPPETPRWLILCGTDDPIALAFAGTVSYLRLPASRLADQFVTTDSGVRAVINIPLLIGELRLK